MMGKTWDEKEWDRMVDRRWGRPGPAVSLLEHGALFLACVASGFLMVTLPNLDKEGFQPREHVAKQDAEKDAENPDPGAAVGSTDLLGGEAALPLELGKEKLAGAFEGFALKFGEFAVGEGGEDIGIGSEESGFLEGGLTSLAVPFSEDAEVAAAKPVTEAPKP